MQNWKNEKLSPFLDGRKLYLMIKLINNSGQRKHLLIHRLVAQAFIPNPNNLPEVNHKDKNTQNPKVENLEWCTRKDNLYDSYKTMSPARNTNPCTMYKGDLLIGNFNSISEAERYAYDFFGASQSMLSKHLRWKDIYLVPENKSRKLYNKEFVVDVTTIPI